MHPLRQRDGHMRNIAVGDLAEQMLDAIQQPCPLYNIDGLNNPTKGASGKCVRSSIASLALGVLLPAHARLQIHWAELPLFYRIVDAHLEAQMLLFVGDLENQYLMRMMPEPISIFFEVEGTVRKNSSTSSAEQNPITFSTPARLYQLRSNSTISPPAGRCGT